MADDWEADDWEAEDYKPALPKSAPAAPAAAAEVETTGATLLAKINEPDMSKFEGEDEGAEPEPEHSIKPQVVGVCVLRGDGGGGTRARLCSVYAHNYCAHNHIIACACAPLQTRARHTAHSRTPPPNARTRTRRHTHTPSKTAQPKKKVEKKYEMGEPVDQALDDPVLEKLRRQR